MIAQKVADHLSERIDHEITIDRVEINWFDDAVLKNVRIKDPNDEQMIYVEELSLDFKFTSLFSDPIVIEEAQIHRPHVNLIKDTSGTLNMNHFINTIRNSFKKKKKKKKRKWIAFMTQKVLLVNGEFNYSDKRKPVMDDPDRFDHNHFSFDSINVAVDDLFIRRDTFNLTAHHLSAMERKLQFPIIDLDTRMELNRSKMEFSNLSIDLGRSHISNLIRFEFTHIRQMNYFNDSVNVVADLDSTVFYSKDLSIVAPTLKQYEDSWYLHGNINGKMKKFKADSFQLKFGDRSNLKGEFRLTGIPKILETEMRVQLEDSHIYPEDIRQYLGIKEYSEEKKFGKIDLNARFDGFPTDFVAYGKFNTDLGYINSDLRFKLDEVKLPHYSGHLLTKGFDLGRFLNKDKVGKIDLNGKIRGTGFSVEEGTINLDAVISRLDLFKYSYKNIVVDGELKNSYFDGFLKVTDKNLRLRSRGKVDLRPGKNIFRVKTLIDTANLMQLGITEDTAFFRSYLDLGFKGLTPDELEGMAKLQGTHMIYEGRELKMNDFELESRKSDSSRTFKLKSSYFDVLAEGDFEFKSLYKDGANLLQEYILLFKNDNELTEEYYNKKKSEYTPKKYAMNYDILVHRLTPLTNLFFPEVEISDSAHFHGTFFNGESARFTVASQFDKLIFKEHTFENNQVEISASKMTDNTTALASFLVTSETQQYLNSPNTRDLNIAGTWTKNQIDFSASIHQHGKSNYADLNGNMSFYEDSSVIHLLPSEVSLVQQIWRVDSSNSIVLTDQAKEITFNHLVLSNEDQKIGLDGMFSEQQDKTASFSIQNFNLLNLEPIINTKLEGRFNGNLDLKEIYGAINFKCILDVDSLVAEGIQIGHIDGTMDWLREEQLLNLNTNLFSDTSVIAKLQGTYNHRIDSAQLDMNLVLNNTNIKFLEPYLAGQVTKLNGIANGEIKILGNLKHPDFFGKTKISNGTFKIAYLNSQYYFNDYIHFNYDSIYLNRMVVQDSVSKFNISKNGHTAVLNGGLTHELFKNFTVNLKASLNNCLVLNTKAGDNDLFYGKGIATGTVSMYGTFSDLNIDSKELTSNKGTNIIIPTSSTSSIVQHSFITYVSKDKEEDNVEKDSNQVTFSVSGITMNLYFNVTRDASFTIIYDEEVFYVNKGYGGITMGIDTREDEFTMHGSYTIEDGSYNFKFANIIDKKFKAKPGGTVSWDGDPYEGTIDLTAYYQQNTKLLPIFDTAVVDASSAEANKPYPVIVLMKLKNKLLAPDIDFDIEFADVPSTVMGTSGAPVSTNDFIKKFDRRINDDEQELNRQVFSLMVLQQLSPENSFQGGDVSGNVTELIANQFSAWLSQVDENVEVDIDLNSLDEDALQSLRFRLSVEALDGKIRITRDGGFTNVDNTANLNSLMGEVTVEYMITDDGRLRLKAYNKTNQNTISTSLQNNNSQLYGASIMYTQSFNNLSDLIKKKQKEKKNKQTNKTEIKKEEEVSVEEKK